MLTAVARAGDTARDLSTARRGGMGTARFGRLRQA